MLYALLLAVMGPTLQFSQWYVAPENNQPAAEAMAWLNGHLDLEGRGGDVARYEGKNYNVFPPLWTIVCFLVYGFNALVLGEPLIFWTWLYVAVLALPLPIACVAAFRGSAKCDHAWAAILAFAAIAGTCLWPVASYCREGWIYSIQLILAQTGLAIMLADVFGRRRFWPAGLGVLIAAWSRQTCIFYAIPVLWMAWRNPDRRGSLLKAGIPIAITLAVPMVLNTAKFGSPIETGYRYIFDEPKASGAEMLDMVGPDGEVEIFSWRYFGRHFYYMWIAPPMAVELTDKGLSIEGHGGGTAVWIGTPLLLLAFFHARRWWEDPDRRALMLATLPVILALLLYHGPTIGQGGYYRYSLDFGIVWLVVAAPGMVATKRMRTLTLACVAYSVAYFYLTRGL